MMRLCWCAMKVLLLLAVLAAPALAFDTFPSDFTGGPTDLRCYTRFAHLAPGLGRVVISLGTFPVTTLDYGQRTGYQAINQGHYPLSFHPAGECTLGPITSYGPIRLYAQSYSTVLLVGHGPALRLLQLPDDPSLPPAGRVRVRLVNAALDAPPQTLQTTTCQPLVCTLPAGGISPYQQLPARTNGFCLMAPHAATPLLQIPPLPRTGRVFTIVISSGQSAVCPYQALVLVDRN